MLRALQIRVLVRVCNMERNSYTPQKKKRKRKSEHVSKKEKKVNYGTDSHTNVQTNKGNTLKTKLYEKKK